MRYTGIETARFIAIMAVIAIHLYPTSTFLGEIINQSSRFAVPFFFLVSGYFFTLKYRKGESNLDIQFLQFSIKISAIYLFWYFIYAYWPVFAPENWSELKEFGVIYSLQQETAVLISEFKNHFFYYTLAGGRAYHLWFLPALLCGVGLLYIFLKINLFRVGLGLAFCLFVMALLLEPYKESWLGLPFNLGGRNGPFFSSVFVFIGAFLSMSEDKYAEYKWIPALLISSLFLQISEAMWIKYIYSIPVTEQNYVLSTLLFASLFSMYFIRNSNFGENLLIHRLGKYTLGIYVSHVIVIYILRTNNLMPNFALLSLVVVASCSLLLTFLFSRVPVLKKTVGF